MQRNRHHRRPALLYRQARQRLPPNRRRVHVEAWPRLLRDRVHSSGSAFAPNQAAQVWSSLIDNAAHTQHVMSIDAIKARRHLMFPALDLSILEMRVYIDATWAKNRDLSSQLDHNFSG